jgi:hypothetical protein
MSIHYACMHVCSMYNVHSNFYNVHAVHSTLIMYVCHGHIRTQLLTKKTEGSYLCMHSYSKNNTYYLTPYIGISYS